MCSLRQYDDIWPDLTPWLGSLVVDLQHRKKGVGTHLIRAIQEKAKSLGYNALYLFTLKLMLPAYYIHRGWTFIGTKTLRGHTATIMKSDLQEKIFVIQPANITASLVKKLLTEQFPEYKDLPITPLEMQGHDNHTFRIGSTMLIRMPTKEVYALAVPKEHEFLPLLAPHLSTTIPTPLKMGIPSEQYPFPFSLYQWIPGKSLNTITCSEACLEHLAWALAHFLTELQKISLPGEEKLTPGPHNYWRGDHLQIYDVDARHQIMACHTLIDAKKALELWEKAMSTRWHGHPVWIHGDYAPGNILIHNGKLSGVIDFGGMGIGDPACDLVIAWTFFKKPHREIFQKAMNLDKDTWCRAQAWALWKATYELCTMPQSTDAIKQVEIISNILD